MKLLTPNPFFLLINRGERKHISDCRYMRLHQKCTSMTNTGARMTLLCAPLYFLCNRPLNNGNNSHFSYEKVILVIVAEVEVAVAEVVATLIIVTELIDEFVKWIGKLLSAHIKQFTKRHLGYITMQKRERWTMFVMYLCCARTVTRVGCNSGITAATLSKMVLDVLRTSQVIVYANTSDNVLVISSDKLSFITASLPCPLYSTD